MGRRVDKSDPSDPFSYFFLFTTSFYVGGLFETMPGLFQITYHG